jgi:hypothetical protein
MMRVQPLLGGLMLVALAGCLQAETDPAQTNGLTANSAAVAFDQLIAERSYTLYSTQSPCDERTDPSLQTHCKFFTPTAGQRVGPGTQRLNVTGQLARTPDAGQGRLLFSASRQGRPIVEYKPIPAGAPLTVLVDPAHWDASTGASSWLFRLDWEGLGQAQAVVRVRAAGVQPGT